MGNNIPKSYQEFERAFQRKENMLTGKEQILRLMKDKGMINHNHELANGQRQDNELFKSIFPDKNDLLKSETGFSPRKRKQRSKSNLDGHHSDPAKKLMKLYVYLSNEDWKEEIIVDEPYDLTCGWLISEVTRRYETFLTKRKETLTNQETEAGSIASAGLSQKGKSSQKKLIVGLKWHEHSFNIPIDYYLTQHEMPLYRLPDGLEMDIYFSNWAKDRKLFMKSVITEKSKLSKKDFTFLNVIGRGGYSKVVWARKKDSGRLYALKIMDKSDIETDKINPRIVINERNIQIMFNKHPFFLDLYWTFQDEEHFYLVTELCIGGSLYHLLNTHKALGESTIRFYASEILLMLKVMHDNNVIYRDLKPENILIDAEGHLKLADYGLAKIVKSHSDPNETFWGSPEYMPPEMLFGDVHYKTLDFYTFGCLLHEMVAEFPPHYSKNREKMNFNIMHEEPLLDIAASSELKHLIRWCLKRNPEERPKWVEEIMGHQFFKSVNWLNVEAKKVTPPWVPSLINHFNKKLTAMSIVDNEIVSTPELLKRYDSRTSIYFEKLDWDESDTSIYMMRMPSGDENDMLNESMVMKSVQQCTMRKKRSSMFTGTSLNNFEMQYEPEAEIQFRHYLKSMLRRSISKNKESKDKKAFEIKLMEADSSEELSSAGDNYENGTITDCDDSPLIKVNSIIEPHQKISISDVQKMLDHGREFDSTDSYSNQRKLHIGPRIQDNVEIIQKGYDTIPQCVSEYGTLRSYATVESKKEDTPLPLENKISFSNFKTKEETVKPYLPINRIISKLCSVESSDQCATPNFWEEASQKSPDSKPEKSRNLKLQSITERRMDWRLRKSTQNSADLASPGWYHEIDSAKLPSNQDLSLLYVNDIHSTARKSSTHKKVKRLNGNSSHTQRRRKKKWTSSSISDFSSKCSVFSKQSLDPRFRQITELIYDSPCIHRDKVKKKPSKLKSNVQRLIGTKSNPIAVEMLTNSPNRGKH